MNEPDFATSGPPVRGRSCGSCSACCVQLPISGLPWGRKKANERCPKLRTAGCCGIYATRPIDCRVWSCRWLFDEETAELRRPDRSGVVIDCMPDRVVTNGHAGHAIQIWVDPARPTAHRDPALRRYLALMSERFGVPVIVRFSSREGLTLVPPALSRSGDWLEVPNQLLTEEQMKARLAEVAATQAAAP